MRNLILNFLYLMYRYYRSRKNTTDSFAYFEAIISLIIAFIFIGFHLMWFLDLSNYVPLSNSDTPRYLKYLIGTIITIPIVYVLSRLFKKVDVLKIKMDRLSRRKGYFLIIFYFIFTFTLLMYQAFKKVTIYDCF